MKPLAPAIRKVWMLKYLIGWSVLLVFAAAYDTVAFVFADESLLPPGLASLLVLVVGSASTIGIPQLRYRFWRYELLTDELYLERGILNRIRTIVPLRRIQHLDVSQDIVEREFDLGKLIVHTAGSRSSDVVLPGLKLSEAEKLRDQVKRYILEDRVEDAV